MNNPLIVLLLVIPMATGLVCVPLVNRRLLCRVIGVVGFAATCALAVTFLVVANVGDGLTSGGGAAPGGGILVTQMGGWLAPYGITLVFDGMSGLLVAAAALVALCSFVHAFASLTADVERRYFHPLIHFMMLGVNLSFLTGDLFNLFVAFEVMLMASYGLLVIGKGREQLRQAYKYVLMNLLASTVFVIAAGMTYGMMGTLNIADLARLSREMAAVDALPAGFTALAVLFLFVFALKAGVFPLWFWLPDTYPTVPIAVAGLFGGVLTKVGTYAIARTFPLVFMAGEASSVLTPILLWGAALTMAVGVLGALAYAGLRRVLCLLIVVGVGYSILGVAVGSGPALGGAVFYMVQSMPVLCAAFLCCGIVEHKTGTDHLGRIGGLLRGNAWLGVAFFIIAMSLVGLPPTSGFYGKLAVIRESLGERFIAAGIVAMVVGGFTLLAVLRVWGHLFWGEERGNVDGRLRPADRSAKLAVGTLVAASLSLGLVAQPAYRLAAQAGADLADPTRYIEAVLQNPAFVVAESPVAADSNPPAESGVHPAAGLTSAATGNLP